MKKIDYAINNKPKYWKEMSKKRNKKSFMC